MSKKYQWLIYWVVLIGAIGLAGFAFMPKAADGSIEDCIDATCRVTSEGNNTPMGTGCAFERSQGTVFVLTCAHIATGQAVNCEFWSEGHKSVPIAGRVIARDPTVDVAIIAIPETAFGGILPDTIPVADAREVLQPGQTIVSVGCANGSWSTAWKGHVVRDSQATLIFRPPPANGRSGSAIFDSMGEKIVGLLHARNDKDGVGIATTVRALRQRLGKVKVNVNAGPASVRVKTAKPYPHTKTGCAPSPPGTVTTYKLPDAIPREPKTQFGGCPPGGCPPQQQQQQPRNLLPYRYRQGERDQGQNGRIQNIERAWPTLPTPAPPAPLQQDIDLSGIEAKLDAMIELLNKQQQSPPLPGPLPPLVPVPDPAFSGPDPETLEEIEKAKAEAAEAKAAAAQIAQANEAARDESRSQLESVATQQSKMAQVVDQLIGDRETLRERFDERLAKVKAELGEEASKRDVVKAYAKDYAADKLSGGAGWQLGSTLGLSIPLSLGLAAAGFLASRRIGSKIEADEPLIVQRVASAIGDRIDSIRDRVGNTQPPTPAPPVAPAPAAPPPQPQVVVAPMAVPQQPPAAPPAAPPAPPAGQ